MHLPRARELDECYPLGVAGLETHGGAGGNVESHADGLRAIESQRAVHLEEVKMRAHLDRPVAGILDGQLEGAASDVRLDVTAREQVLPWNHDAVLCPGVDSLGVGALGTRGSEADPGADEHGSRHAVGYAATGTTFRGAVVRLTAAGR